MLDTASPLEVLWTATSLFCLLYIVRNLHAAMSDRAVLHHYLESHDLAQSVSYRTTAAQNVRCESMRLYFALFFVALGVNALLQPHALDRHADVRTVVFAALFVVSNGLLAITSYMDFRDRVTILAETPVAGTRKEGGP